MRRDLFSRVHVASRGEDGFAMVAAVTLTSVMMIFTIGMLATGIHLTEATVRDESWNRALQVAEAGVDHALYMLETEPTYLGSGAGTIEVPGGEAQVLVSSAAAGFVTVYSTGWSPSQDAANASRRRIRVDYAPEDTFSFALFSTTGLAVKANGHTEGDIFANNSVLLEENTVVDGSVTSATGTIELDNGAAIREDEDSAGSAYSGGYDEIDLFGITLGNNAVIQGDAYAQAESCPGETDDSTRYNILANGTIQGSATARGSVSGNVGGTRSSYVCEERAATRVLPQYNWDSSLYAGEIEYTSLATFQAWVAGNQTNLTGVHRLWDPLCSADPSGELTKISLNGAHVTDDFVLVTNCRIDANNDFNVDAPSEAIVNLIVQNASSDPPAIVIKNNFEVNNGAAVLVYSTGLIEVKNNIDESGAVYAGAISIKNNMEVTYDARVERTLGFGDMKYDRLAWMECRASTTDTDC